jgi:hypothetical protein
MAPSSGFKPEFPDPQSGVLFAGRQGRIWSLVSASNRPHHPYEERLHTTRPSETMNIEVENDGSQEVLREALSGGQRRLREMSGLHYAAVEWRDARAAIFSTDAPTSEMWTRLANAEHALMTIARKL